jgi:hypothetical protein
MREWKNYYQLLTYVYFPAVAPPLARADSGTIAIVPIMVLAVLAANIMFNISRRPVLLLSLLLMVLSTALIDTSSSLNEEEEEEEEEDKVCVVKAD